MSVDAAISYSNDPPLSGYAKFFIIFIMIVIGYYLTIVMVIVDCIRIYGNYGWPSLLVWLSRYAI